VAVAAFWLLLVANASAQQPAPKSLVGHTGPVNMAIFTPDARHIVTAGADQSIRLWNSATSEEVRALAGHTDQVLGVAIDPTSSLIASAGGDNTLRLWDIPRPEPLATLEGHPSTSASSVSVSVDGNLFLSAGGDKVARLYGAVDGKTIAVLAGHASELTASAFRVDNQQVATADLGGEIRLWSAVDGSLQGVVGAHPGRINKIEFHPNNQQLVSVADDGLLKVWQLPTPAIKTFAGHTGDVRTLQITGDSQTVVTGDDATVRVFSLANPQTVRELAGHVGKVQSLAISRNNAIVASGSETGRIKLWNLADGADRLELVGHAGAIHALAFHPDNARVASAGADGTIRVWRLPVAPAALNGHTADALALATSPDGLTAATGSVDKSVRLWNTANGQAVRQLDGHTEAVRAITYRADGAQLATADAAGVLRLWNPADGAVQGVLGAHGAGVSAIAYSADGTQLATTSDDGTFKLWKLPLNAAKSLAGNAEAVSDVAISGDGKLVVTGGVDKTVRVYDGATAQELRQLGPAGGIVTSLATTLDGSIAVAGSDDGLIRFWHTADGTPRTSPPPQEGQPAPAAPPLAFSQIAGHTGAVLDLAIDEKNQRIATAGADGSVRLWRMPSLPEIVVPSGSAITKFIASPDGKWVATAGVQEDRPAVVVREAATGKIVGSLLGHTAAITHISFSKDGTRIASAAADKTARMWNLADAKFPEVARVDHAVDISAVAVSDDNTRLITAAADNVIRIWPLPLAEGQAAIEAKGHSGAITALRASGTTVISASADATVRVWNVADGAAVRSISHGAAVSGVAVSADGTLVASGGADNSVKLWNGADGAAVATLAGHPSAVLQLEFSGDGLRLASTSAEGIGLWDVPGKRKLESLAIGQFKLQGVALAGGNLLAAAADGAILRITPHILQVFDGHTGAVEGIAISPDGQQLVSSGVDKTVRLWDAATGKAIRSFTGPQDVVTALAISSDAARLVASSADKNIYSWPLAAAAAEVPAEFALTTAAAVRDVRLSADGQRLLAAGDDMLVHVWDLASRREIERFIGHAAAVSSLAVSADGNTIASGSADKTARISPISVTGFIVADEKPLVDLAFAGNAAQPANSNWLTIGSDNAVNVWSVDGKLLRSLPLGEKSPRRLAVRPAGTELAVLLSDGYVQVFTIADGKLLYTLEAPAAAAVAEGSPAPPPGQLCYSGDGLKLLVGVRDDLRVFDAASGRLLEAYKEPAALTGVAFGTEAAVVTTRIGAAGNVGLRQLCLERLITGHEGTVNGLAFNVDGNLLASGGADKSVRLWDTKEGALVRRFAGPTAAVTAVAITADGMKIVAGSEDKIARAWNVSPPADAAAADAAAGVAPLLEIVHPQPVRGISPSGDSLKLATCGGDGIARVWDLTTGKELERFAAHPAAALAVAFAADNRSVVSGGAGGSVQGGTIALLRGIVAHPKKANDLALLQGGAQAATVGAEGSLKLWNLADGAMVRETKSGESPLVTVAARADNQQFAAADAEGRLYLWNAAGEAITQFKTTSVIRQLRYSPDSLKLVAACAEKCLRFYNPADGAMLYELVAEQPLRSAAFTMDSTRVLTADDAGGVRLWKYASPTAIRTLTGHGGRVYAVAFSPDGKQIASASADQTLRIWDAATGAQLKQLTGHVGAVYGLAYSSDGALVASCGADKTLRLWDVLGARQLKQIDSPETVYSLAFHNDNRRLAAAGLDKTIRILDAVTGAEAAKLEGHADFVYRVQFNAAGSRLLSCGYGGAIKLWDLAGKPVFSQELDGVANSAALSPDGTRIIVAGGDGAVYLLDVPESAR
jgi:WD40 repeat protein